MYQISSKSSEFCRKYYEKHFGLFFSGQSVLDGVDMSIINKQK